MLNVLEERIQSLTEQVEKSAAHHNALVGMLMEAKRFHEFVVSQDSDKCCNIVSEVIEVPAETA